MTYDAPELVQVGVATNIVLGFANGRTDSSTSTGDPTSPTPESVLGLDD
jgi:hypothetical protein